MLPEPDSDSLHIPIFYLKNNLKNSTLVKKTFLLLFATLLTCHQISARVLFVKSGSHGDGSSWHMAFGGLQHALSIAIEGDEIWVASGVYHPTQNNDRDVAFLIPSGVKLLGGFAGNESSSAYRDFTLNRTILSGEIGSPVTDADNSFTVVVFWNASPQTVLDGFEISGGNANNPVQGINPSNCGGAIFNDGSRSASSPTISNCQFKHNRAFFGGAIYNNALEGNCSMTRILNCEFLENDATIEGGAVFNQGSDNGLCNLTIRNCNFEGNQASYGAGIFNIANNYGKTNPVVENCTFNRNGATIRASAIYNASTNFGESAPVMSGCTFDNNSEMVGGNIGGNATGGIEDKKPKRSIIIRSTPPAPNITAPSVNGRY